MVPSLDIFKINGGDVLWRAKRWQPWTPPRLASEDSRSHRPGEYFILDQNTVQRTFVTPLPGSAQIERPSVESGYAPRVGMG